LVAVRGRNINKDGVVFLVANVSNRTHGWIQREALASPTQRGDDARLLRIIGSSPSEYEKISLSRIFLEYFSRSPLRSQVLLIMGETAEAAAAPLSRGAAKQLGKRFTEASDESVYLNYSGLDRYNRLGVRFLFDSRLRELHYDGWAWREILRAHPKSSAAEVARTRLSELASRFRQ
jgi:hypothetical protein